MSSAAIRTTGSSMKPSDCSSNSIRDSTSFRSLQSSTQASARKAARLSHDISAAASASSTIFRQRSGSITAPVVDLSVQIRLCPSPFPLNRHRRELQHLGGFFDVQTAEEPEFHDLTLARIHCCQTRQSVVESNELGRSL